MKSLFLHSSGKWYYRQCIPVDLRNHFSGRADIAQSLKTKSKTDAKNLASQLKSQYTRTFTLLRAGIPVDISPALIQRTKKERIEEPVKASMTLSGLFERYTEEHRVGWKEKSLGEFLGWFRLLEKIIGDIDITQIDRTVCITCRDTLVRIPPGYTRSKDLRDLPVSELIRVESSGLHPKTVNKHLQMLSSVFKWAVKYNYMLFNPADGLSLTTTTTAVVEQRSPFSLSDLQLIIDKLPTTAAEKWIPLISMFSGLRLEEIAQLQSTDIKLIDNIWCIDLTTEGKELKTSAAARIVPLHSILIKSGLIDYKNTCVDNKNMWGFVKAGKYGWSKTYSQRFGRWLRKNITDDKTKVFHSFRHNVADALKLAVVPEPLCKQILGHANTDITTGRYGSKYPVGVIKNAIEQINYKLVYDKLLP